MFRGSGALESLFLGMLKSEDLEHKSWKMLASLLSYNLLAEDSYFVCRAQIRLGRGDATVTVSK